MSEYAKQLLEEAREIAEEELAFVADYPTSDSVIVSRRATYKRQLTLCDALEAAIEREREGRETLLDARADVRTLAHALRLRELTDEAYLAQRGADKIDMALGVPTDKEKEC